MSNISQTQTNLATGAAGGIDLFDFTTDGAGPFTPPTGCRGWKYFITTAETTLGALTETGGSPASTGIVGPAIGSGALISANGLFTSVGLGAGQIVMVRG